MGFMDQLSQKIRRQGVDKRIKQAKALMVEGKYQEAREVLDDLQGTYYEVTACHYRYDEIDNLWDECRDRGTDQAIEQAKALMAEGKYQEARGVLGEYVWTSCYRSDELNALYDVCKQAEAGEPQPTAPTAKPTPKPEPKPAPKLAPRPKAEKPVDAKKVFDMGVAALDQGYYDTAARYFREAAEAGHATAQFNLAVMYSRGEGVKQSKAEAAKWYRKAAEQGDTTAQFNLGVFYDDGNGVPQDKAEAAKWYRKAAEQGNVKAQFNLAVSYAIGEGVSRDLAEAEKWAKRAADGGHKKAAELLADIRKLR